jgi:hypothetical protein
MGGNGIYRAMLEVYQSIDESTQPGLGMLHRTVVSGQGAMAHCL